MTYWAYVHGYAAQIARHTGDRAPSEVPCVKRNETSSHGASGVAQGYVYDGQGDAA